MQQKQFPNGFTSWMETHYEVVAFIENHLNLPDSMQRGSFISGVLGQQGHGGLYELAEMWTDEFENKNVDTEWDGDFFDSLEEFLSGRNTLKLA